MSEVWKHMYFYINTCAIDQGGVCSIKNSQVTIVYRGSYRPFQVDHFL